MMLSFNVSGQERKRLVSVIENSTGEYQLIVCTYDGKRKRGIRMIKREYLTEYDEYLHGNRYNITISTDNFHAKLRGEDV